MTPDEVTLINESDGELFAALIFLAALAYPESHRKRDRAYAALRSFAERQYAKLGSGLERAPPLLSQAMQGQLRRVSERIEKRLFAARIATRLLIAGEKLSLNEIHRSAAGADFEHFKDRIWAPTLPVLHLAIALRSVATAQRLTLSIPRLIVNPSWVSSALCDAESLAKTLPAARNTPRALRGFVVVPKVRLQSSNSDC